MKTKQNNLHFTRENNKAWLQLDKKRTKTVKLKI